MSALIGALRVSLSADTASFEQGMARARKNANSTAGSINKSFSGIASTLKSTAAAFGVALSVGTVVAAGKAALEYASHLSELADTLGLTTKDLQTFSYAAGQVGISQEDLETGIQKLTISMGKAQLGSEAQIKAFNAIGISIDQLKGKNAGDVFRLIAESLEKVSDRSERAAVEVALFGKSGAKLDNLLSGSQGRLNELSDAAEKLGIVLSDEQIQNADHTADKIRALETVLKARLAGIVADNSDAILSLAEALGQVARAAADALAGLRNFYSGALQKTAQFASAHPQIADALFGKGYSQNVRVNAFHDRLNQATAGMLADKTPRPTGGTVSNFLGGGGGGSKKADHSAEDAERKRLELLRNANDFLQEQLHAEQDILQAKKDLSTDYSEQTTLEVQLLDSERASYKAQLDYEVASKDKTKAQADALLALYDQADSLKRQKLIQDEAEHRERDNAMLAQHDFDRRRDVLQSQEAIATTQDERRKIELELLQIAYEQKRKALQDIIDHSKDQAAIEDARRDLLNLNKTYANDRQGVMNQTAGPLESYLNSIPHDAATINEALQGIEVEGLQGIVDALSHVGEGWKAMRDIALRAIQDILAQLIKLQIEKMLFSMIGGSSVVPTLTDVTPVTPFHFAGGGSFNILGRTGTDKNVLSLNDIPIANVNYGERLTIGNDNERHGGQFIFNNYAQMTPQQARKTGMQAAAGYQSEMARARSKGIS
jgi:hypothetical protein